MGQIACLANRPYFQPPLMYHKSTFTHGQLHKCVTWIPVREQPPHEEPWETGNVGEGFPRRLIETETQHPFQIQYNEIK